MKGALPTVLGGLAGGATGRKLGAMEVASQFPGFHECHGNNHEIIAAILGTILGGITGRRLGTKLTTKTQIQDTIQS